jgi:hypothetical protein
LARRFTLTGASLAVLGVTAACAETTGPTERTTGLSVPAPVRPSPGGPLFTITEGPQEPPAGLPEGYNWYTTITVEADAGWRNNYSEAYGQSVVNYVGMNAKAEVTLHITEGPTSLNKITNAEESDDAWPATRGLTASASLPSDPAQCGLQSYALANGRVWNKWFLNSSWTTWGTKTASDSDQEPGPACPPPPPGDGGGNGGGGGGGGGDGAEHRNEDYSEPGGSSGTQMCYYTHWWVSYDGGNTWHYQGTDFHGCYDVE